MSRLSIELTNEQHQQIKTIATLQGKSIKDYVIEKIFPTQINDDDEQKAWGELQSLLNTRITDVEQGAISQKTFEQITAETIQKWNKN